MNLAEDSCLVLHCSVSFFISSCDVDLLEHKWFPSVGRHNLPGYLGRSEFIPDGIPRPAFKNGKEYKTRGYRKNLKLHQVVAHRMGLVCGFNEVIDHRDLNIFNNTRGNLRVLTASASSVNRNFTRRSNTGILGVTQLRGSFKARFRNDYKIFDNLSDATSWRESQVSSFWEGHSA